MVTRVVLRLVLLTISAGIARGIVGKGHVTEVQGLEGRSVDLPCDISNTDPDDRAMLVLWFRDAESTPTYSFDGRNDRSFSERTELGDRGTNVRATLVQASRPAVLRLATVRRGDAGRYRCRVDFRRSPTRNQRVLLTVIIPPGQPQFSHWGQPVSGTIGPLQEDESLEVSCTSRGGSPPPRVTWYRDGRLLDDTDSGDQGSGRVTNVLRLPPLTRDDLHSTLVCSASNNNISSPIISKLVVDMNFRPLFVEILGSSRTSMQTGRSYELVCYTAGSRPAANITWWIGEKRLLGDTIKESGGGNITTSILPFTPTPADNDRHIRCQAENGLVRRGAVDDRRELNVRFAPIVRLRLGQSLDPENIREGQDVYFECNIDANPHIYSFIWSHDGNLVEPSPRSNVGDVIIINERSLVIRNLTRRSAGNYLCRAFNPEGEGVSRPVLLNVLYSPVCVPEQQMQYGTAKSEAAHVACEVDANPANVTFRWHFNSSIETLDLPFSQITSRGMKSSAFYTPKTDLDYGLLVCSADNGIGSMTKPCGFRIVPAGPPEPVHNCTVINQTSESLQVACAAGFDGGLHQRFVAELYDVSSGRLERNLSRSEPSFTVSRLPAGLELRLQLYAANSRGRSRPTTLDGFTLKAAEKRISSSSSSGGSGGGSGSSSSGSSSSSTGTAPPPERSPAVTPLLGVLIGVVASLIIIAIGVVACIKGSSRNLSKPPLQTDLVHSSLMIKRHGAGTSPEPAGHTHTAVKLCDAENPDVIPNSHDLGYDLAPTSHLLNHLNVSTPRKGSPTPSGRPMSHELSNKHSRGGVTFAELTLPRSGRAGKVTRSPDLDPVMTFATFNPRRPALATTGVRTVTCADQESVV